MKRLTSRSAVISITAAIVAIGIAGPVWADGGDNATGSTANTILIKAEGKTLKFVAPKTIVDGEDLTITNTTNAKKVGPHTFSLVTESELAADQEGTEALLHAEAHLQSDRRLARCQGQRPSDQEPR